jgi:hypothetical protein
VIPSTRLFESASLIKKSAVRGMELGEIIQAAEADKLVVNGTWCLPYSELCELQQASDLVVHRREPLFTRLTLHYAGGRSRDIVWQYLQDESQPDNEKWRKMGYEVLSLDCSRALKPTRDQ